MNAYRTSLRLVTVSALLFGEAALSRGQTIWDLESRYNGYGAWADRMSEEMKRPTTLQNTQPPAKPWITKSVPGFSIHYPASWAVAPISPDENVIQGYIKNRTRRTKKGEQWMDIAVTAALLVWGDRQSGMGMFTESIIADLKKQNPGLKEIRQTIIDLPFGHGLQTNFVRTTEFKYEESVALLTFDVPTGFFQVVVSAPETEYEALVPVLKDIVKSITFPASVAGLKKTVASFKRDGNHGDSD